MCTPIPFQKKQEITLMPIYFSFINQWETTPLFFCYEKIFHLFIQENIQKCHLGNFFKGNYSWDKSSKTPESVFEYIVTLYFEMDTMKKIFLNVH